MTATESKTAHLEFKWTTSRGRDTYGYNICTLYVDGRRAARCNGGGYDMKGTSLGNYLARAFANRLLALTPADMPEQSHWERAEKPRRICRNASCLIVDEPWLAHDQLTCPKCGADTEVDYNDGKRVDDGRYFYGLRFVDPTYDARKATLERSDGTFTKPEDEGKTLGELDAAGKLVDLDLYRAHYKATSPHPTERHTVPTIDGACGFLSVEKIAEAIGLKLEYLPSRKKNDTAYLLRGV